MSIRQRYNTTYDLTNCAAEPLRFIRSCQHQVAMIVLYAADLRIKAVSENCAERYGRPVEELIGADAGAVLSEEAVEAIRSVESGQEITFLNPIELTRQDKDGRAVAYANLLVHQQGELLILEIEPRDPGYGSTAFLAKLDKAISRIQASIEHDGDLLFDTTVREVKSITGFDRVWLYRFDEDYNGEVVAEARNEGLETFLHLRYPHTDIPKQARDLYLRQQIRMITDTREDADHLLISDDGEAIDLSEAAGRSVSPIHLEYLRNLDVGASLSIAITVNNRLWGLISCHHGESRLIDFRIRQLLGFFGRIVSGHLAVFQTTTYHEEVLATNLTRSRVLDRMAAGINLTEALAITDPGILDLVGAAGAALLFEGQFVTLGDCPRKEEVKQLLSLMDDDTEHLYATNRLHDVFPAAREFHTAPAGLICIRITQSPGQYILWFRPELITTVDWGGSPQRRKLIKDGQVRLHPEISFTKYTETVRGRSEAWKSYELNNARELRNDIKEVILVKYQEIQRVNEELSNAYEELESFSYTVSHDLRAPLRSIKGFTKILQEDYTHKLDEDGQAALNVIMNNVTRMTQFIDGILDLSRLSKESVMVEQLDLPALIEGVWLNISTHEPIELQTDLRVSTLPGHHQLMWRVILNLLTNAIKYRRKDVDSFVRITSYRRGGDIVIQVSDNGIGFDMKYAGQIFALFNRLVAEEEYDGTGLGLAIVQRIVEKHKGTVTADGKLGEGATFSISIPEDLDELTTLSD